MSNLPFFPFPRVENGVRFEGSVVSWPPACLSCRTKPCEAGTPGDIELCSFGINYQKLSSNLTVAGVVLSDWKHSSPARRKRIGEQRQHLVSTKTFRHVIDVHERAVTEITAQKSAALDESRTSLADSEQFKAAFMNQFREEILRGLSFVHDYKQINAQIAQNINVVIENRYTGPTLEDKLGKADRAEKAIYFASKFLEEKLNVAKFLLNPAWLSVPSECLPFRVHGMVIKYVRIYQALYEGKQVRLSVRGESHHEIVANPQACGVIPHTFLDNALKYAPKGSSVDLDIQDRADGVELSISSLGPRIESGELRKVFHAFYRAKAAREEVEEGAGYGLYVSQLVAKEHLGAEIVVHQEKRPRTAKAFLTTFSILFPLRATIAR